MVASETGRLDDALESYRDAAQLLGAVRDDVKDPRQCRSALAATYLYTGLAQRAAGRLHDALQSHHRAIQLWKQLPGPQDLTGWYQRNVALTYWAMANVHLDAAHFSEARGLLDEARKIQEELRTQNANDQVFDKDLRDQLAYNDHTMGELHYRMGQPIEACRYLEKARQCRAELVEATPKDIWLLCNLAKTQVRLASAYSAGGHGAEARSLLSHACEALDRLVADNKEVTEFQRTLAEANLNIGKIQQQENETDKARASFAKAMKICKELSEQDPTVTQTRVILADSHAGLSRVSHAQGQPAEALNSLRDAERIWDRLHTEHPDVPRFWTGLEEVRSEIARLQEE
jgi:tetratricopeptide (TPR) repeat protein